MAKVNQRPWKIPGQRTKRKAWGFTAQINGKQVRSYKAEWSQDDAEKALALLQLEQKKATAAAGITLDGAVDRYLGLKARKKTVKHDTRHLAVMKAYFGAETPLAEITASRISAWKAERLAATCPQTGEPYSAAAINRPLSVLRHAAPAGSRRVGSTRGGAQDTRREGAAGRIRWLGQYAPDEETRLMDACKASRAPQLAAIVTVGLETGLRRGELLGLTWDRVDLSRGVLRLEITKSGKRREVPMRQPVYDILAAMPEPRQGRVWRVKNTRTAFESAVTRAGLEDFHFHDLRHFASTFVMRGGGLPALQALLGHASLTMTCGTPTWPRIICGPRSPGGSDRRPSVSFCQRKSQRKSPTRRQRRVQIAAIPRSSLHSSTSTRVSL